MRTIRPGVAAHHPVTAQIGADVLRQGGNAADAAVTATFAACVCETVLTGLAGGGFAVYWDAAAKAATTLDFFVDVPRNKGSAPPAVYHMDFGSQTVPYTVGPNSVGVPGVVPGLGALWERFGTLGWTEVLAPARRVAQSGVPMTAEHAAVLDMLSSVLTLSDGGQIYAPGGQLLGPGDNLHQPGLDRALNIVADEGPCAFTTGSLARMTVALMEEQGGSLSTNDFELYTPKWGEPGRLNRTRNQLLVRDDLAGLRKVLQAVDAADTPGSRAVAMATALRGSASTGTTNITAVDGAGNACVVSSSMGLGSGDFLPGLDLHLNSMLGEVDLLPGGHNKGERMSSNMIPLLVIDDDGLVAAGGAAGGSRIPGAMLQVLLPVVDGGIDPQVAIDAPRWHTLPDVLHHEPGVDPRVVIALTEAGWIPQAWPKRHYYFGGVNVIARNGGGGDPRRSGAVRWS